MLSRRVGGRIEMIRCSRDFECLIENRVTPLAKETPMAVHELFTYLRAKDAEKMIAFYRQAFGATEKFRLVEPSRRIGHAELILGNAILMLSDESTMSTLRR
jgi:hypothetical protein